MNNGNKHIIEAVLVALATCIALFLAFAVKYCVELQQIQYEEPAEVIHDIPATQADIDYWENYKKQQEKPKVQTVSVNTTAYPPINPIIGTYTFGEYTCKYYSSNVSRHYRIGEWNCDKDFWRDKDGYFVVALCDKQAVDEERIIPIADGV